jgi:hypothetical protein
MPAPRRQRQKDHEFQASLDYIVTPCFKSQRGGDFFFDKIEASPFPVHDSILNNDPNF